MCVSGRRGTGPALGGFSLNSYGSVGYGYDTALVYFDLFLAVNGTPVHSGREIRALLQHTTQGESLTYAMARGQQQFTVTLPIQESLDRLFFRTRYDFRQTIAALSRELTTLLDLDEIVGRIVHTVLSALGVARVALYLDDGHGTCQPMAAVGEAAEHLASIRPRCDNPVVELVARQRYGVSRYDLEAAPMLVQAAPHAPVEFDRLGVSLAFPLIFKQDVTGDREHGDQLWHRRGGFHIAVYEVLTQGTPVETVRV